MRVIKPVIIVGTGRCGSTALHRLLALHPDVSWLSGFLAQQFDARVNRWLMHAIDFPLIGPYLGRRFKPWECYSFWNRHCPGFSRPCRDLCAGDVTHKMRATLPPALARLVTSRRNRLLIKVTGWPRVGFLKEIFPDVKFVHIVRDGRAVANSILTTDFWDGWRGPSSWRWGPLLPAEQDIWERCGRSFVALAAIEWNKLVSAMDEARRTVPPEQFLEVKYETLCLDRISVVQNILDFCELPQSRTFEAALRQFPLEDRNGKWQQDLTIEQQVLLTELMGPQLRQRGYL